MAAVGEGFTPWLRGFMIALPPDSRRAAASRWTRPPNPGAI
ncbi:MAG TPA: hypothetical protein VFJ87_04185 [Rhodanobacteraceae bacterium]|jgi:hypothetical protein|nr:hypothetical protein [Rhodanobacteraceae bacterium]